MTATLWRGEPIAVLIDAAGDSDRVRRLLHASGLQIFRIEAHPPTLVAPTVGIFGHERPPVPGCHAWYVGSGSTPAWMHATHGCGDDSAVEVLRMLGTALAQEQAGVEFRAAGAGRRPVDGLVLDPEVLGGVDRAVAPVRVSAPARPAASGDPESLLRKAFAAIEVCCAPNGAIAAAPRAGPGEPDYWFCWPRDAAAAALALQALSSCGPADLRSRAAALGQGYLAFVEHLSHGDALGTSRFTMSGEPVGGYGDPQHDGPAATVLAVLTLDPTALGLARPYIEHLLMSSSRRGFDLWELTQGRSFHAANLRRRALALVAGLALGVDDALAERCHVADERAAFADPAGGWRHVLDPEPAWFGETSRLDVSVVGSALTGAGANTDLGTCGEPDPRVHETALRLAEHYGARWPVNLAWQNAGHLGGGIGRFPEDANDGFGSTGGNPWPIATLWLAQHHFRRGDRELAEGYLSFILAHVDPAAISEQIEAVTGAPRGARGLVWAHAELVQTLVARATCLAAADAVREIG